MKLAAGNSCGFRAAASLALLALLLVPRGAEARTGRERASEQIPELMGRILDSQEEIRARESEVAPLLAEYDAALVGARQRIERAASEADAAEALVDYVEAYDRRVEVQTEGLRAIEAPIVRMRSDARELAKAASAAGEGAGRPEERQPLFEQHFQGVASGLSQLAGPLGREQEAAVAGSVLQAGWATHSSLEIPLAQLGPDGARAFAQRAEGLYARFQARSAQLQAERRALRQLLDLLIQRQLGARLEGLFAGGDLGNGLGALLSGSGKSDDWNDVANVVGRVMGLPSASSGSGASDPALDRLDYFASGQHRQ